MTICKLLEMTCAGGMPKTESYEATTNQEFEPMRRSNFALRLQPSLLEELRKSAEAEEGVAVNQLINVAVAFPAGLNGIWELVARPRSCPPQKLW
jgi:hypothetical protein